MATVDITAEERNELWGLGHMALYGAFEGLSRCRDAQHDEVVEAQQWLCALDVLGLAKESDKGCSVPLSLPFIYVVDAAEKQALDAINDDSKTLARVIAGMSSDEIAEHFLPPAEGDEDGSYLIAFRHIKAVRERMEAAEPGLRQVGSDE